MQIGNIVLLKQGLRYVRAIVVSIDTDFISLDVNYNRGKGTILKVRKDSKNIIKLDFTNKEVFKGNLEAFDYKDDFFRA